MRSDRGYCRETYTASDFHCVRISVFGNSAILKLWKQLAIVQADSLKSQLHIPLQCAGITVAVNHFMQHIVSDT